MGNSLYIKLLIVTKSLSAVIFSCDRWRGGITTVFVYVRLYVCRLAHLSRLVFFIMFLLSNLHDTFTRH